MLHLVLMRVVLSAVAIGFMLSMEAAERASVRRLSGTVLSPSFQRTEAASGQPPQGWVEGITLMAHGAVERECAAILSADVVGYSRLMSEDEVSTILKPTDYVKRLRCSSGDSRVVR